MSANSNEKIEKACMDALEKIKKFDNPDLKDIESKLEWVIGSYRYDLNPSGLFEIGSKALEILQQIKAEKPRLVPKKLIEELEKALATSA
jgi:hypothetical protein